MTAIEFLANLIRKQEICDATTFDGYESRIEMRYESNFEKAWMRCFDQLVAVKLNEDDNARLNELREIAFKVAYKHTDDPDLAGLVSDDFELIGKAATSGTNAPWLNSLWLAYRDKIFPAGTLTETDGDLSLLIAP